MCGIAGIVNFDGQPVARAVIGAMTSSLAHRGPDGEGVWLQGPVAFGHRRLAIRDLGDGGRQPMKDASGRITVVFNGEIYNDRELRHLLAKETGTSFHTQCDAEVLAPGWSAWGLSLFDRLQGMFAVAIWDDRREQLILARDPAGIKPLFFRYQRAALHFASELKGLLAFPGPRPALSAPGLHRFMASGYPGPTRTLLSDIEQIPPGCVLVADRAGSQIHRYWTPTRSGEIRRMDEAVEGFSALWKQVVSETLISDVPVGVLLSGGIDSSLIAAQLKGTGRYAFTGRLPLAAWDESSSAAVTAGDAGLDHRVADVDIDREVEATFRTVVAHVDGQLADSSCVPFYRVCQEARKVVPVLLSGDGADEFFGGYPTYRATRIAEAIRPVLPSAVGKALVAGLRRATRHSRVPVPMTEQLGRFFAGILASQPGHSHAQWRRYLMSEDRVALYGPALRDVLADDPLADYTRMATAAGATLVDRCLLADQTYYLPADMLAKADAMSMAHGLEIRVPFLDRRVMEFAGRLAPHLLTPWFGQAKPVLRRALVATGIGASVARQPKRGFNMPVAHTLRRGLRPLGERYLDHNADCLSPWFDPVRVRALWRAHDGLTADHGYVLWALLTLAEWKTSVLTA